MTNHKDKMHNKDGSCSPYAFICGYLDTYGDWLNGNGVRLYADGCYHVKGGGIGDRGANVWETFHYLKDARRFAREFGTLQTQHLGEGY